MANIESQKKRIITNEKARQRNVSTKSEIRTLLKNVQLAVSAGKKEEAIQKLQEAISLIDKSVVKGVQHPKTAARQKSRVQGLVNTLK
jgi:small subunit ribosomal protein S20